MDTLEEVKEILRENARQMAESRIKWEKELAEERAERQASQANWEKRMAKLEASQRKTDEQQRKTEAEQRKTDEILRETVRKLDEVGLRLGNIGINLGDFAEELFYTSLKDNPELGGIHYDIIKRNIMDDNRKTEYDILMFNGDSAAIVEVKYKAHPKDIERLLKTKPQAFRKSYSEYADHKLYLGLASTVTHQAIIDEAENAGIYLLGQQGEHVEVMNQKVRAF